MAGMLICAGMFGRLCPVRLFVPVLFAGIPNLCRLLMALTVFAGYLLKLPAFSNFFLLWPAYIYLSYLLNIAVYTTVHLLDFSIYHGIIVYQHA
jgi:hypothetical protein